MSPEDRIQGLLEANTDLVLKNRALKTMLRNCRDQFAKYGENHRAKEASSDKELAANIKKAETNESFASEIDILLSEI